MGSIEKTVSGEGVGDANANANEFDAAITVDGPESMARKKRNSFNVEDDDQHQKTATTLAFRTPSSTENDDDPSGIDDDPKAAKRSWIASAWTETRIFGELAVGTTLMYLGFAALPLLTASCVGRRFGPLCLTAFSLANLTGNLCTQTLVFGLLGAIDTLGPQAVGKGDHHLPEVGLLAVRGFLVTMMVLVPINIALVVGLEPLLVAVGEDPEAAHLARKWYQIYVASLPFSVVYECLCKFLTVQNITAPIALISVVLTMAIGPFLEFSATALGFYGTAVAYVSFWVAAATLLLAYVWIEQPHDPRTWPGKGSKGSGKNDSHESSSLSSTAIVLWKSSTEPTALREFVVLGVGGVVAQCEWVFWEALGLVVGKLGVLAMTAHAIPTQIIYSVATFPISCGIALAVRIGISLPTNVPKARTIAAVVTAAAVTLSWTFSVVLYRYRDVLINLFLDASEGSSSSSIDDIDIDNELDDTNASPELVYQLADSIWSEVSVFNFNCQLFGILTGICSGLGKQWALGTINVFFLWVLGMPVIYYAAMHQNNPGSGLETIWFWMNAAYAGINLSLLGFVFVGTDWYAVQASILAEEEEDASATATAGDADDQRQRPEALAAANERTALLRAP